MEKATLDYDLPLIAKELRIEFQRSFTIYEFIKEIKDKLQIFSTKREEKNKKANLVMINSYKKDIENNLGEILYEYKIILKNKEWS